MLLDFLESKKLLDKYALLYPGSTVVKPGFNTVKYPVVLKVDSPSVMHKSDLGLVFTKLSTKADVMSKAEVAKRILEDHKIKDYRLIAQEMVKGSELLVGMKRDRTFGPVIMFGFGGVLVELLKDVSMRIAPLTKKDCLEMISEVKSSKLLDGYRNNPKIDRQVIVDLLLKTSRLAMAEKHITEIDFNPVIVNETGAYVVDARMIRDDPDA